MSTKNDRAVPINALRVADVPAFVSPKSVISRGTNTLLNIPGLEEQQHTGLVKKLMAEADQEAKPWVHHPEVFSKGEADKLFVYFSKQSWVMGSGARDEVCPNLGGYYLSYGTPYSGRNSKEKKEVAGPIPTTPGWQNLLNRVQAKFRAPVNYVQCHLFAPGHAVHPHFDPGGMIVPMLTLGQERTFRVGGSCPECYPGTPAYVLEQTCRDISTHIPTDEHLMKHGDLLVFIGGNTIHSMYPAAKDPQFNRNGYDWRISILFRWTSPAMAQYGAGNASHKKEMKQQYADALAQWRQENPEGETA